MLELKLNGEFVAKVREGRRFKLQDGRVVSPAVSGWALDGYTLETYVEPTPPPKTDAELRAEWRQTASVSRADFCVALKQAGILPANEAKQAARGEWPATFAGALAGFPDADEAEIIWAAVSVIERLHPMLLALQAFAGLTDEQLDSLLGYT